MRTIDIRLWPSKAEKVVFELDNLNLQINTTFESSMTVIAKIEGFLCHPTASVGMGRYLELSYNDDDLDFMTDLRPPTLSLQHPLQR